MSRNSSGIAMTTSQAPWVNLVTSTMTRTTAVMTAPNALIARAGACGARAAVRSSAKLPVPVPDHAGSG